MKNDLTAIGCLLLSVKFNEYYPCLPNYDEFLTPQREYYTKEEISNYEKTCLTLLEYKLDTFTSYDIIKFFFVHGFIHCDEETSERIYTQSIENMIYFINNSLCMGYTTVQIAISSILLATEKITPKQVTKVKDNIEQCYGISLDEELNSFCFLKSFLLSKQINEDKINKKRQSCATDRITTDLNNLYTRMKYIQPNQINLHCYSNQNQFQNKRQSYFNYFPSKAPLMCLNNTNYPLMMTQQNMFYPQPYPHLQYDSYGGKENKCFINNYDTESTQFNSYRKYDEESFCNL